MITIRNSVKFFFLTFLFCFSPILQVNATTIKSISSTRTEYMPFTNSNPDYEKKYEFDLVIPCGGQIQAKKIDDNDSSQVSFIGSVLGSGLALSSSTGKDRIWIVPAGGTS